MDLRDYFNVRRVFRILAAEWGCPVWMVKRIIQRTITHNWEKAMFDLEAKSLWNKYFPNGKPSPEQYVLQLGHIQENGEDMPSFLNE